MRQVGTSDRAGRRGARPLRRIHAWASHLRPLRAGTGSALALALICGGWFAGALHGGKGNDVVSAASSAVGLSADNITISGQVETGEADVLAALGIAGRGTLVGLDTDAARNRLMTLPWVLDATVRKFYPGRLEVSLVEKRAAAVWQLDDKLTVVDPKGEPIARFGIADLINDRFSHLPHLVGNGAAREAGSILSLVAAYPQLAGRVQAFLRVSDRRWDLLISAPGGANVRVMLPHVMPDVALDRLAALQNERQVLDRQVESVDLRLADRLVLRLEDDAATARDELVADRAKAMRKILRDAKKRAI